MDFNLNFEYSPEIAAGDGGDGGNGARSTATTVTQTGSNTNFAITNSTLVDGLDFGAGYGSNDSDSTVANSSTDIESMVGYANYTMGSVTVGYTMSQSRGGSAASAANEVNAYGIAFNVNDNLSISYNEHNNDYKKTSSDGSTGSGQADVEQESKGIAIAYTMGGATLAIQQNEMDNVKGVQNTNDEITEISLSLAF
jgi:predicted porin